MNKARVNNGLSVIVERNKLDCRSHPSQGRMLIFERKDVELHLSRNCYTKVTDTVERESYPGR